MLRLLVSFVQTLAHCFWPGKRTIPQNECVFAGVLVVVAPDRLDVEPQALVERPRRGVRLPHFERRARRPGGDRIAKDFFEQPPRKSPSPPGEIDGQTINVE